MKLKNNSPPSLNKTSADRVVLPAEALAKAGGGVYITDCVEYRFYTLYKW
jgi:hypothetical protein